MSYRNFEQAQGIQRRTLAAELRIAGDEFALAGYAAKFNKLSQDLGGFKERIAPGAFSRSLKAGDEVVCLMNHDPSKILGRTRNRSVRLECDSMGLRFYCALNPNDPEHKSIYQKVLTGLIDRCSFAFTVPFGGDLWEAGRDDDDKECQIRTLKDVDLLDVSVVTYPAYEDTAVNAREKYGYGRKQAVSSNDSAPMTQLEKVETLRAAARAMGKNLLALAERDCPNCAGGGDDRAKAIRGHMELCAQMLECSVATAETVENIWDGWDEEDDSIRKRTSATYQAKRKKLREMHREFHRMLGECCNNHALMRLSATEILD